MNRINHLSVNDVLNDILKQNFLIQNKHLKPTQHIQRDLNLNILEVNEMLLLLENRLHISLDHIEPQKLITIGDLIQAIHQSNPNI